MYNLSDKAREVLAALPKGKNNAITAKELSKLTGQDTRQIRESIHALRESGEPVASSVHPPYGFFIPEGAEEAKECLNQLYSRIQEIYKTARSLESGIKQKFSKVS